MAKNKPSPSTSSPATPAAKPTATKAKSSKKLSAAKASSNGAATRADGSFGCEMIGQTAGAVWGLLSEKGEITLTAVKKEITAPSDLILAAVGWLAREDKLDFVTRGRSVKLALK